MPTGFSDNSDNILTLIALTATLINEKYPRLMRKYIIRLVNDKKTPFRKSAS
jgi:hypothetical protein